MDGFEGLWHVDHATLPNGTFAYTGTIAVKKHDQTYTLTWDITAGHYVGIGILKNQHLYVSCGETFDQLGIALYDQDVNGFLTGQWSMPELDGIIGKVLFTSPHSGAIEGKHLVNHANQETGEEKFWELSIMRKEDIFEAAWKHRNGQELAGLGLEAENGVAVGWYPDLKQLAFMDYTFDTEEGNTLSARWALGGFSKLGTERLTRL